MATLRDVNESVYSPLQKSLKAIYLSSRGDIITVNQHMLRELENDTFILGDLEISVEEIPLLVKFLTCKEALTKISTLVVSRKFVNAMPTGRKSTQIQTAKQSSLQMNKCKLQYAIIDFIAHSMNLHTVVFDSVTLKPELFSKLGAALSSKKGADLKTLSFKSVALGCNGMRSLCAHIGKSAMQVLEFEKCELGDDCGPFLASILKAQEARLDQLFWNSTLRMDPQEVDFGFAEESLFVYSEGMVLLNLSGNSLSDAGISQLTKVLKKNHWLLGINLSNNQLSVDGLDALTSSLSANAALHACCLAGNPGLTLSTVEAVASITTNVQSRIDIMPEKVATLLRRWMKMQANEMYSFVPARSPSAGRVSVSSGVESSLVWGTSSLNNASSGEACDMLGITDSSAFPVTSESSASWTRKVKQRPMSAAGQARPKRTGHPNGHEMDDENERPTFKLGDVGALRNFDGQDIIGSSDSLEFAIPTPMESSDFQGSLELSVRASGDFYQQPGASGVAADGRPPSRNSLRPRVLAESLPTKTTLKKPSGTSAPKARLQPSGSFSATHSSMSGGHWPPSNDPKHGSRTGVQRERETRVKTKRPKSAPTVGATESSRAKGSRTQSKSSTSSITKTARSMSSSGTKASISSTERQTNRVLKRLVSVSVMMERGMSALKDVSETLSDTINMSMQNISVHRDASASFSSRSSQASPSPVRKSPASSPNRQISSPLGSSFVRSPSKGSSISPARNSPLSQQEIESMIKEKMRQRLRDFISSA